jgi:hypothetical protein
MDVLNNNNKEGENHDKEEGGSRDSGCGEDKGSEGSRDSGSSNGSRDSGSREGGSSNGSSNLLSELINNNSILSELFVNQLKNISPQKKLSYCDIQRINKFLKTSIFSSNCSLWTGYITNDKNINKGVYINFYYNKKKIALHRLLYANYVGEISDKEYIKYNCINKGKCCNIHHMSKFTYKKNDSTNSKNKKEGIQQIDTNLTLEL